MRQIIYIFWQCLRIVVLVLMVVSGISVLTMMAVTCLDVLLRRTPFPLIGAVDIVRISGALTVACALPYTTAVKGHVAIEYFFHKLSPRGRIIVDSIVRPIGMTLFAILAKQCFRYGHSLKANGQVSPTLQIPEFWIPHLIGVCCAVVVLVILHNLLYPGRGMMKP